MDINMEDRDRMKIYKYKYMVYRIQEDRQKAFCREKNKDIEYSINDIINDPGQFNVFTRELKINQE